MGEAGPARARKPRSAGPKKGQPVTIAVFQYERFRQTRLPGSANGAGGTTTVYNNSIIASCKRCSDAAIWDEMQPFQWQKRQNFKIKFGTGECARKFRKS
jgi:hypothetical protein